MAIHAVRNRTIFFLLSVGPLLASSARAQDTANSPRVPANPLLVAHSNFFKPARVYDLESDVHSKGSVPPGLTYKVYSAVGYDIANSIMLVGPDKGIVIVDTLGDQETVEQQLISEWRKKLSLGPTEKLPVRAIIYTHNHLDHIGGVNGYLHEADKPACPVENAENAGQDGSYTARGDCVEVIGQANIIDGVAATATISGDMINPRSAYMYGNGLPGGPVNAGIGPQVNGGTSGFRLPSRSFTNRLNLSAAGMNMQVIYVPSETNDELVVFIPDALNGGADSNGSGLLLSAEVIQGPSFPNLYSLRGTSYRSAAVWFHSVDKLRALNSWCMVPSHGPPLCGPNNVALLLRNFRDAIEFTHDQAVRLFNMGYTPDELVTQIKLPQYLINELDALKPAMPSPDMDPKDYLRAFYGSVPQSVRAVYVGYLGWFEADPVLLNPTPPRELAGGYIQLMGGRDRLLKEARAAFDSGRYQWAAKLMTLVIRVNHDDKQARVLKANAFRQLAQSPTNPNWRNWYLSSAIELELPRNLPAIVGGLTSPDVVAGLPPDRWVDSWTVHFDPRKNRDGSSSLGFEFPAEPGFPEGQYVIRLRRAVSEFITVDNTQVSKRAWQATDATISMTRQALQDLLNEEATQIKAKNQDAFVTALVSEISKGEVKVTKGSQTQVQQFFATFDAPMLTIPSLTVR